MITYENLRMVILNWPKLNFTNISKDSVSKYPKVWIYVEIFIEINVTVDIYLHKETKNTGKALY